MSAVDLGHFFTGLRRRQPRRRTAPPPVRGAASLQHTIDIRQGRFTILITCLTAGVVVACLAGLWFGRFAQTETTRGVVAATGGFSRLDAPRDGVVSKIFVRQGELVKRGQAIYALRLGTATADGQSVVDAEVANLQRTRKSLREEIDRANRFIADAARQQARIRAEQSDFYNGLKDQLRATSVAMEKSRGTVRRLSRYVKAGYATRDVLEAQERTAFEYDRQLAEIRLKRLEAERQDSERQRDYETLVASKVSQGQANQAQIETIETRLATLKTQTGVDVQAEESGRVVAIAARVGDSVKSGQFVAAVGDPTAAPLIVVDAPARAVGLAKVGQRVILKYDAYPYKTFGIQHGTITYISAAAVRAPAGPPPEKGDTGVDARPSDRQSAYRIEIKPDKTSIDAYGEAIPLKIGSTLSADIIVERRRLIDWVVDPIRALRGR